MAGPTVQGARELAPMAARLASASERRRALEPELSKAIAAAGLYRLCVPASVGGGEAPPAQLLESVEVLARGDGAAGWCVAVCATAGMLAAYLEPEAAAEVYGGAATVVGGVFAPSGRADANDELLSIVGALALREQRRALRLGDGRLRRPRRRRGADARVRAPRHPPRAVRRRRRSRWSTPGRSPGCVRPAATMWSPTPLAIPAARSASLLTGAPREPGPLYAFPPFGLLAGAIAAVGLGIARGALDDVGELAGVKTPTLSTRKLAERASTQSGIARAEAAVRSARALLYDAVERAWEAARTDRTIPLELRAGLRLAATNAIESSASAVDAAWSLAGGSAIYETGALERRFRDIHAATQHMLVGPATWELTGRSLLGLEFDSTQL